MDDGGGWFMGSYISHRGMCSRLAKQARMKLLSINYRLAPEYPFPAGLDDCVKAYHWLQSQGYSSNQITVAGDSAGGNLTLALLLKFKAEGSDLPYSAVCFSPATDLTGSGTTYSTRRDKDPFFGNLTDSQVFDDYIGDNDRKNPLISPLFGSLDGLPPILIHVGEYEVLLDDSVRFVEKARQAGVNASLKVWPGQIHVFQAFSPLVPEARQSIREIAEFLNSHE
ncbi:MAG: alpha/beta hydrolase [Candidatus Heimdallarchaeota archaeon]|nr:alpha/beta hydrolase [Candidatus Heimdallarchaeota archaeon]